MKNIDYEPNKPIIESFYKRLGLSDEFVKEDAYLESSYNEINKIWFENLENIEKVRYLMIAEAPLWGKMKKYIYNPETKNSQFFHRSDLEEALNISISNKKEFLKICNEIGFLIIDISPYPLNSVDTSINYRNMTRNEYRRLVSLTIPSFFEKKLSIVAQKRSPIIKVFFRYSRVKNAFQDLISDVLIENGFIKEQSEIGDISQQGGGIDRMKLQSIINQG